MFFFLQLEVLFSPLCNSHEANASNALHQCGTGGIQMAQTEEIIKEVDAVSASLSNINSHFENLTQIIICKSFKCVLSVINKNCKCN